MKILITGAAGFIGSNLVMRLLGTESCVKIVGLDNLSDYYDTSLKQYRLGQIEKTAEQFPEAGWKFIKGNIADKELVDSLFAEEDFDIVVNLAAQAGVRMSDIKPYEYIESNIIGFYNILEACREYPVKHLVFASSSSVYGGNTKFPFNEDDRTDTPESLYAATKKSDEVIAHAFHKLYGIPATGLRFFTVYGPAGRPDMAYFKFTDRLVKGDKIQIYNYGNCQRDFTYIDDVVEGIQRVMGKAPDGFRIYNIGNSQPVSLLDFVQTLQEELVGAGILPHDYDFAAHQELLPMQAGDVTATFSDSSSLEREFGFRPSTPLRTGLRQFAQWYADYYKTSDDER